MTRGRDVAVNGMIIEQQQILTTQNLAVLISDLDLVNDLAVTLPNSLVAASIGFADDSRRTRRLGIPS